MYSKMPNRIIFLLIGLAWVCNIYYGDAANCRTKKVNNCPKKFSLESLMKRMNPLEIAVTQNGAMEAPGTGAYIVRQLKNGKIKCVVCTKDLFNSVNQLTARDYATFDKAIENAVALSALPDGSAEEASCTDCGSDVGRKEKDGKFKINSAAVKFEETVPKKKSKLLKAVRKLTGKKGN